MLESLSYAVRKHINEMVQTMTDVLVPAFSTIVVEAKAKTKIEGQRIHVTTEPLAPNQASKRMSQPAHLHGHGC